MSPVESEMTISHGVCHQVVAIMDRLVEKRAASLDFLATRRRSIGSCIGKYSRVFTETVPHHKIRWET